MNLSNMHYGNMSLIDDVWHDGASWRYKIEAPDGTEVVAGPCETEDGAVAAVQSAYSHRATMRARRHP